MTSRGMSAFRSMAAGSSFSSRNRRSSGSIDIECLALFGRHRGVGQHPIRDEAAEEEALGDAEPLRTGEEQLFRVVDFLFVLLESVRAHGAGTK